MSERQPCVALSSYDSSYSISGFEVLYMGVPEADILKDFAVKWIYALLPEEITLKGCSNSLEKYHIWSEKYGVDHNRIFCARNRHITPPEEIKNCLLNKRVKDFLRRIGIKEYRLWDEGLGWLGFRFIRPGFGDGYPFTRKEWGIAKNVVSFWIPVIGYTARETITIVPGSHKRDYERYLPDENKFRKDEYRLKSPVKDMELFNPTLKKGEVIAYHPRTLHSEEVRCSEITRLNLEFRIDPIKSDLPGHKKV